MDEQRKAKRKRLTIVLSLIFCLALVMGAGPGIYLINPDPSDPTISDQHSQGGKTLDGVIWTQYPDFFII